MGARRLLHRIQAFAHLSASLNRRRRAWFTRRGRARFSRRSSFRDRCGFIGKIDVMDSPKSSADPYNDDYDHNYDKDQATFSETAHSSFWRRFNPDVHFRNSMWILGCATFSWSYRLRNLSEEVRLRTHKSDVTRTCNQELRKRTLCASMIVKMRTSFRVLDEMEHRSLARQPALQCCSTWLLTEMPTAWLVRKSAIVAKTR
jgi:hypothetical protein